MKFIVKKDILVSCLRNINSIIENNINPTLSGVHIKTQDNELIFRATNGSTCYEQKIKDVQIKEGGDILIKSKLLYDYVSKIDQEEITINQIDDRILQISAQKFSCEINLVDDSTFPILDFSYDNWKKITLSLDTLLSIQQRIKPFVSSLFTSPNLSACGILFNPIDEKQMECVASDSFRIAYYKFDYTGDSVKFVIEPKAIDMAIEILTSQKAKSIDFFFSEKECILNAGDILIKYLLYKLSTYPNIINAVLSQQKHSFKIKLNDLINALNRGSVFVSKEQRPIADFKIENNKLNIKFISAETGNDLETIDLIECHTEVFETRINQKLLSSLLNTIKSETITFNFSSNNSPIIISSDNPYFLNLIVPIKSL